MLPLDDDGSPLLELDELCEEELVAELLVPELVIDEPGGVYELELLPPAGLLEEGSGGPPELELEEELRELLPPPPVLEDELVGDDDPLDAGDPEDELPGEPLLLEVKTLEDELLDGDPLDEVDEDPPEPELAAELDPPPPDDPPLPPDDDALEPGDPEDEPPGAPLLLEDDGTDGDELLGELLLGLDESEDELESEDEDIRVLLPFADPVR